MVTFVSNRYRLTSWFIVLLARGQGLDNGIVVLNSGNV